MKFSLLVLGLLSVVDRVGAFSGHGDSEEHQVRALQGTKKPTKSRPPLAAPTRSPTPLPTQSPTASPTKSPTAPPTTKAPTAVPILVKDANGFEKCSPGGFSKFQELGHENSERLLLREGVIKKIPTTLCNQPGAKNVILVIGDGMGWEMARAGAIAKRVLRELSELGVNTLTGSNGTAAATLALNEFKGRKLSDYYTSGKGSGLSFMDRLDSFALVTTTAPILQKPEDGNHYAPATSLLDGSVSDHDDGMAPLALNPCGFPIDFSPLDYLVDGGNMVLWNDQLGGQFPWDSRYFGANSTGAFDPFYIMQHATDSANTAGSLATGHKGSVNMVSVDLYEEDVSTLIEDAMTCGKSGGVVTSVPILHATPAAFVSHSNNRNSARQLQKSFETVNPTYASGTCASSLVPSLAHRNSMLPGGSLSSQWKFLYQGLNNATAANFYDPIQSADPDDGTHVLVCFGGIYTNNSRSEGNMPFRGVDSSYSNRWCSRGSAVSNANGTVIGFVPTTNACDHWTVQEKAQIPKMNVQVREAINFLGKDDQGFFMMYEQGDIDWAAHANHMDDMLGALLDIDEGVSEIINWIQSNGGWEKNALYVTADHDHYLTLNDDFPELLAKYIIAGQSRDITPRNNTNTNPMSAAVTAGYHLTNRTQLDILDDFRTWTDQDIRNVGHFWGARGAGGNGWGSHTMRPVPLFYKGDNGCVNALTGKGYQVLGREVAGSPGKIDQVHLHACMLKALFGLV